MENNSRWIKVALGAGVVGALAWVGTSFRSSRPMPALPHMTPDENAAVGRDTVLHVALGRLEVYATGDVDAHVALMSAVGRLMLINLSTTINLHRAEQHLLTVKRSLGKIRAVTLSRSANNIEVMEEFEEVAQVVQNACADKLFNLHQAFTLYK